MFNQYDTEARAPKDIAKAYRLGREDRDATRPRPVLVKMISNRDNRRLIANRFIRKNIKKNDIDMKDDLTEKQRDKLKQLRGEGFLAYYRGTQLITKPRPDFVNASENCHSASSHGDNRFQDVSDASDNEEWEGSHPLPPGVKPWGRPIRQYSQLSPGGRSAPDPPLACRTLPLRDVHLGVGGIGRKQKQSSCFVSFLVLGAF
jgi:hypothetical protein